MTISDLSHHELNWIVAGALAKSGVAVDETEAKAAMVEEIRSALVAKGVSEQFRIHVVHSPAELEQHLSSQSVLLTKTPLPSHLQANQAMDGIEIYADLSGLTSVICITIPLSLSDLKERLEQQFAKDNTDLIPNGDIQLAMLCC